MGLLDKPEIHLTLTSFWIKSKVATPFQRTGKRPMKLRGGTFKGAMDEHSRTLGIRNAMWTTLTFLAGLQ